MNSKKFFKYVEKGNQEKILDFINQGFDINIRNELDEDAQTIAYKTQQLDLALWLIQNGANPFGYIFQMSVKNKDNELFSRLKPYLHFSEVSQRAHCPLHKVAQYGTFEQLHFLVEKGFNINYQDYFGRTPLMYAVQHGDAKKVDFLLKKGTNIYLKSIRGYNVIQYLQKANIENEEELLILFLKHGVSLDILKEPYDGLLSHCVKKDFYKLACLLLEKGYDANEIDSQQKTPLMYAAENANPRFIHLLLYFGANPFIEDSNHKKAIMYLPNYNELMSFYLLQSAEYKQKRG